MPALAKVPDFSKRLPDGGRLLTEGEAWAGAGEGRRPLHGNDRQFGFSFEWHDYIAAAEVDWGQSFHPGSIEICLNLAGRGCVSDGLRTLSFAPMTAGFYGQDRVKLAGTRSGTDRHQFLTVELTRSFLRGNFTEDEVHIDPVVQSFLQGRTPFALSEVVRLSAAHQQLLASLRHPPVLAGAQRVWYQAKALELMSAFLFRAPGERELFCQRQNRVNQDRVDRVIAILKSDLAEPPALEALARQIGCSSFYLSRTFTRQMGKTISQYLRQMRMERAADLLRAGSLTVTQVAMEVGYSSSSHFSTAFHEAFGCCPGLYPLATPTQRPVYDAESAGIASHRQRFAN